MVENWFMACVPGSKFVTDWKNEFIKINDHSSLCKYIDSVANEGIVFNIKYVVCYLAMHVANQKIQQQNKNAYNLALLVAEDDAFKHLEYKVEYNLFYIIPGLINILKGKSKDTNIIKIRGGEREILQAHKNVFG
jgi:hypothetical protein